MRPAIMSAQRSAPIERRNFKTARIGAASMQSLTAKVRNQKVGRTEHRLLAKLIRRRTAMRHAAQCLIQEPQNAA
jgi:hypothetical protein